MPRITYKSENTSSLTLLGWFPSFWGQTKGKEGQGASVQGNDYGLRKHFVGEGQLLTLNQRWKLRCFWRLNRQHRDKVEHVVIEGVTSLGNMLLAVCALKILLGRLAPLYLFVYLFIYSIHSCVCVWLYARCVKVPMEARRGYQIPWSCSYRQLWVAWHGCWELNSAPLEDRHLKDELSLQPQLSTLLIMS